MQHRERASWTHPDVLDGGAVTSLGRADEDLVVDVGGSSEFLQGQSQLSCTQEGSKANRTHPETLRDAVAQVLGRHSSRLCDPLNLEAVLVGARAHDGASGRVSQACMAGVDVGEEGRVEVPDVRICAEPSALAQAGWLQARDAPALT